MLKPQKVEPLLTERQAAVVLNCSPKTLRNKRWLGTGGPAYVKMGRSVRYRMADLIAFIEERLRKSTSDDGCSR